MAIDLLKEHGRQDVVLGLPHPNKGLYYADSQACVQALVRYATKSGLQVGWSNTSSCDIGGNRNIIAGVAQQMKANYLLFIDDDMVFAENALERLMSHNVDIVSGFCVGRIHPYNPCAYIKIEGADSYRPINNWPDDALIEVDAVGAAFLLIKVAVFDKLTLPYFSFAPREGHPTGIGEDSYFSRKAKAAGLKIHLDTGLIVGHIGDYPFTIHDHIEAKRAEVGGKR